MKYSKHKEVVAEFVIFATQDKYRLAFTKLGMVPEKITIAKDDHFQKDPAWKVFVDIIPTGKCLPLMPWEEVELATQEMLYSVYSGKKDVKQALDELAQVTNQVIEKTGGPH